MEPVLIPIVPDDRRPDADTHDDNVTTIPEWALIEVNGELLLPQDFNKPNNNKENSSRGGDMDCDDQRDNDNTDDGPLVPPDRIELGSLQFIDKKPVMIIGSHRLTGSVVKLSQPFCVLQRDEYTPKDSSDSNNQGLQSMSSSSSTNPTSCYRIKGMVTRKILFNQYPKVIMR